jgi:hypothetical protein
VFTELFSIMSHFPGSVAFLPGLVAPGLVAPGLVAPGLVAPALVGVPAAGVSISYIQSISLSCIADHIMLKKMAIRTFFYILHNLRMLEACVKKKSSFKFFGRLIIATKNLLFFHHRFNLPSFL